MKKIIIMDLIGAKVCYVIKKNVQLLGSRKWSF
jgi:hypothetical protein